MTQIDYATAQIHRIGQDHSQKGEINWINASWISHRIESNKLLMWRVVSRQSAFLGQNKTNKKQQSRNEKSPNWPHFDICVASQPSRQTNSLLEIFVYLRILTTAAFCSLLRLLMLMLMLSERVDERTSRKSESRRHYDDSVFGWEGGLMDDNHRHRCCLFVNWIRWHLMTKSRRLPNVIDRVQCASSRARAC